MPDRERTEEIEFELDDPGSTRELPARPGSGRRAPGGPPRRPAGSPPDGGGGPSGGLMRLALLIGGAILLAVILVLWVNSCREDRKRDQFAGYLDDAGQVGLESQQIGTDLVRLITTPGLTLTDLQTGLEGLRDQQAQNVARAAELEPPGALRDEQASLVEALQFRVSGLGGLARAFGQIDETQDPAQAGQLLQEQSERLVTSDVVYEDLFKARTQAVLQREGVSGVAVPDSNFLQEENADLVSADSWALVVQRLTQGTATGGLRGTSLVGTFALPGGQQLSTAEENTVRASERLAFRVDVENSGDVQLTQVEVTITLQLSPEPVEKTDSIPLIDPGDTKSVSFGDIDVAGSFGTLVPLKVAVEPVEGEENTANNTAEYSVIFTLG